MPVTPEGGGGGSRNRSFRPVAPPPSRPPAGGQSRDTPRGGGGGGGPGGITCVMSPGVQKRSLCEIYEKEMELLPAMMAEALSDGSGRFRSISEPSLAITVEDQWFRS